MQAEKLEKKKLNVTDFLSSPDMEEQFKKTFGDRKVTNDFALNSSQHDIYKQEQKQKKNKDRQNNDMILDSKPKNQTRNKSKSRSKSRQN